MVCGTLCAFEMLPNLDSTAPETLDQLLPWNTKLN